MDGTSAGSCPAADFDISCVEALGSASRQLAIILELLGLNLEHVVLWGISNYFKFLISENKINSEICNCYRQTGRNRYWSKDGPDFG